MKRTEVSILIEAVNSNPNGDPLADNQPRRDTRNEYGYITDVCIKRKIRNWVADHMSDVPGYEIYIDLSKSLNTKQGEARESAGLKALPPKKTKDPVEKVREAALYMCEKYYDVRTFGAMMSTEASCGIVTGPVQAGFAMSYDPVEIIETEMTRHAVTRDKDFETNDRGTFGHKSVVRYGLYRMNFYISPAIAEKTGFTDKDLEVLFEAIEHVFDDDKTAGRAEVNIRKMVVFEHDEPVAGIRSCPSCEAIDSLIVKKNTDRPLSYRDYDVSIDSVDLPSSVTVTERV